jgi:hypothetical protein
MNARIEKTLINAGESVIAVKRTTNAAQLFAAADHVPFAGPALPRLVLRDALRRAAGE